MATFTFTAVSGDVLPDRTIDFPYQGTFSTPMNEYVYHAFYGTGTAPEPFTPGIYFACMLVGYFSNGIVIVATWKNRKLHGSYNFLICMVCLGDMMHLSSNWIYGINIYSGNLFITYRMCFYTNAFFQAGGPLSILMTFFVGVDRLIAISFPTVHRRLNLSAYVSVYMALSLVVMGVVFYFGLEHTWEPSADDYGGRAGAWWSKFRLMANVITLLIYLLVWLMINANTQSAEVSRRVFKSLAVLMAMVVVFSLSTAVADTLIVPRLPLSLWFATRSWMGVLINVASAANFFVLYAFSTEYRSAFRRILGSAFPFLADRWQSERHSTIQQSKSAPNSVRTITNGVLAKERLDYNCGYNLRNCVRVSTRDWSGRI